MSNYIKAYKGLSKINKVSPTSRRLAQGQKYPMVIKVSLLKGEGGSAKIKPLIVKYIHIRDIIYIGGKTIASKKSQTV